jgi:S1-C subfamily serine protease
MHGTGFIVTPDGWIITALHVIADQKTLVKYNKITISIAGHPKPVPAEVMSPVDNPARLRDFAILKVDRINLPSMDLGSEASIEDGSPIAIIGLPLSATFGLPVGSVPCFCLSGTVVAQTALPLGNLQFLHTIYFQGVSIKGISGAPIISLVTGKVIGIVSTKLTGIGRALEDTRQALSQGGEMTVGGFSSVRTTTAIIDTLDNQLANGLGSGTGASDAANALKRAKSEYTQLHPTK